MFRLIWQFFFTFIIECNWVFFTIQDSTVSGSYIVIPQKEETWLSANRICNITYKGKLLSSVEGSKQKTECLNNYTHDVQLWSRKGLILSPYLSHEGCFEISTDLKIQPEKLSPIQSVGECYIHCQGRTSFFGITIDTCYCITDSVSWTLSRTDYSRCHHKCSDSTHENVEYCGGNMTLNLYTSNIQQVLGNKGNRRCSVINCTYPDYHLSAQKCDSIFDYVCAHENYQNGNKVNFVQASSTCTSLFNNYLSPSVSTICHNSQSLDKSKYWLDVRRYSASISDIPHHTTEINFRCGYFTSGISANMEFEDKCINNGTRKRYACETGVVVGVLVTTGIVAAFTLFLVLRRRKVIQRERSKSSEMIESQESKNNFKLEEKQNASQKSHENDQESRHYFQLEANPKNNIDVCSPPQEHLQSEDEYNEADDTVYHETINDVYDHLNERRKKTTDNEDMYHIANGFQSDNDEYQHIHSLKGVTNRESSSDYARFNEDQYSAIQREK